MTISHVHEPWESFSEAAGNSNGRSLVITHLKPFLKGGTHAIKIGSSGVAIGGDPETSGVM
jgi:hypothetical protein